MAGKWGCTWHCGKHAIIRLLPPPATPLCSRRARVRLCWRASMSHQKSFISLMAKLVPGSLVCTRSCHNTFRSNAWCRAKHCHFFFFFYDGRKWLWQVSGLEHPEGGGCKYHLSGRVFFCQEYWHVGPNNSMTQSATGNDAPIILTCENAFSFLFWRNIIDMFVSY